MGVEGLEGLDGLQGLDENERELLSRSPRRVGVVGGGVRVVHSVQLERNRWIRDKEGIRGIR